MAGVQFDPTDEPVFNSFDLPTMCDGVDSSGRPCCDPCQEWMQCLMRTPIEMHLPGFDLSNWLPCVSFVGTKLLQSSGIGGTLSGGGEDDVFHGTYLALSANETLTNGDCGDRGETTLCQDAWEDDGYGGGAVGLSHTVGLGRTILAPNADGDPIKPLRIALRTDCVIVEGEKFVKFTVILVFGFERATGICLQGCEYEGVPICDPAVVAAIDNDGWGSGYLELGCCPIAESDLIPLVGLEWADLDNITLTAVDPPDWELVDPMEPDGPWQLASGNACGVAKVSFIKAVPYQHFGLPPCSPELEAACGSSAFVGHHELGNAGCPHPSESGATVWVEGSQLDCGSLHIWIPPPITMNSGDAFLKVLAQSCRPSDGCSTCIPDAEGAPHAAVPAKFWWTASSGTSCGKTFTPHATDCLNIVRVYWPWGAVTDGLDPVSHTLVNLTDGGSANYSEKITAVAIDDRGCLYCFTNTPACGCCEGVSGSLSITTDPETACTYTFCASVTTTEECGQAFIELQYYDGNPSEPGPCDGGWKDCECTQVVPGNEVDPPCEGWQSCMVALSDGQCFTTAIHLTGRARYRVWDGPCGCASEWVDFPVHCADCNCCAGKVQRVYATIFGWAPGCPGCASVNKRYELEPWPGNDCWWRYGYSGGIGDGDSFTCPSGSEEPDPEYGIQLFYIISCGSSDVGNPTIYELVGSLGVTAGAGATFIKTVVDEIEWEDGAPIPGDCNTLAGLHTQTEDSVEGVCNPLLAYAVIEIEAG